ncbi:ryncolin-4-like [Saccostrea cucullata]|uniref:ryncolin-4-like n=1 Tax=Saccostrea cuccullata TaxID=36930 RepID=UPI002ED3EC73
MCMFYLSFSPTLADGRHGGQHSYALEVFPHDPVIVTAVFEVDPIAGQEFHFWIPEVVMVPEQNVAECAVMCQRECVFFGFNSQTKKCRTHKKSLTSELSAEAGWRYYLDDFLPRDCKDLHEDGQNITGVHDIYPYSTLTIPVTVYCDMTTMGAGWTVIQKRIDGSVIFDKNWTEYKNGFGSPEQNVWVGNDVIHQLTKENSSLYVSITLQNGTTLYEMYDGFSVSNETEKYQLFLAGPATGTLGDAI